MTILKAALGLAASAYVRDRVIRPRAMGEIARKAAERSGKPLLLVHDASIAHYALGSPVATKYQTNVAYPIPVPSKAFGAVLAVGILEKLKRPEAALKEWNRVADRVYAVVPSWWSPHAWLDPSVKWLIDPSLERAMPLWTTSCRTRLLKVSDSRYGTPQCVPTKMRPNPRATSSASRQPASPSPSARTNLSQRSVSEGVTQTGFEYPFLAAEASQTPSPSEDSPENPPSESWSFAKDLMVISSDEYDES